MQGSIYSLVNSTISMASWLVIAVSGSSCGSGNPQKLKLCCEPCSAAVLSIKRGQGIEPGNWLRWPRQAEGRRAWLQLVCCAPLGTVVPKLRVGNRDRRIEK